MIIGFLHATFIMPNVRSLSEGSLVSKLDDYLHRVRAQREDAFPRSAAQYVDTWSSDEFGWLRKYYPPDGDEAWFDITPATEKAIDWLKSLEQRQFVGTESRLKMVFDLLRQMVLATELDAGTRVAELEKKRAEIDGEIQRIRAGRLDLMDPIQVKDCFQQMASTARGLLSDFRELEQNFRDLDRALRERVATWEGGKGALLAEIFGERDAISDSDQGRSFRAFWDLLMSPTRQEELSALLEKVFSLAAVQDLKPDRRLLRVHHDWLAAGEVAQRTVARVSEQLRRYVDDKAWLENRRIVQIIREIEQHGLALRDAPPEGLFMEIDALAPEIELPLERPLFSPPFQPRILAEEILEGDGDVPVDALLDQVYVDKARLAAQIRKALQTRAQVSLAELVEDHPIEQGLAELVAYLSIAVDDRKAIIDDGRHEVVSWFDAAVGRRQATMPLVIFTR
jgi:hypothetical protein